jgi:hypothetical protein
MPKRVNGPQSVEETAAWSKLHIEKLHYTKSSRNIISLVKKEYCATFEDDTAFQKETPEVSLENLLKGPQKQLFSRAKWLKRGAVACFCEPQS